MQRRNLLILSCVCFRLDVSYMLEKTLQLAAQKLYVGKNFTIGSQRILCRASLQFVNDLVFICTAF